MNLANDAPSLTERGVELHRVSAGCWDVWYGDVLYLGRVLRTPVGYTGVVRGDAITVPHDLHEAAHAVADHPHNRKG
jgi:hypothetical protein